MKINDEAQPTQPHLLGSVLCQCTLIEQDETCPVGYPSLLRDDCDGKGFLPIENSIVDAIFDDLRDRRFLKWLFDKQGDRVLIGVFRDGEALTGLDIKVQDEIKGSWRRIIRAAISSGAKE